MTSKISGELLSLMGNIEKEYGRSMYVGDLPQRECIPFSSPWLNYVTWGGVRYGMSTEIVGEESSGKSTAALDIIRNFQPIEEERYKKRKKELEEELAKPKLSKKEEARLLTEQASLTERVAVYLDLEYTTDSNWVAKNKVDESKMIIFQPPPMGVEGPLDKIIQMAETGQVGLIIVDSVGAMMSTAEEEGDVGKGNYGGISKALTKYYKKIMPIISKQNIAHIVINQTREDLNGHNQLVRPGGKMNKFAQSLVLRLRPGIKFEENYAKGSNNSELVYARQTIVQVAKNKVADASRQNGFYTIRMGQGVDRAYDTFSMAMQYGMIVMSGSWITMFHPTNGEEILKVQGSGKAVTYLDENPDIEKLYWDELYRLSTEEEPDQSFFEEDEE